MSDRYTGLDEEWLCRDCGVIVGFDYRDRHDALHEAIGWPVVEPYNLRTCALCGHDDIGAGVTDGEACFVLCHGCVLGHDCYTRWTVHGERPEHPTPCDCEVCVDRAALSSIPTVHGEQPADPEPPFPVGAKVRYRHQPDAGTFTVERCELVKPYWLKPYWKVFYAPEHGNRWDYAVALELVPDEPAASDYPYTCSRCRHDKHEYPCVARAEDGDECGCDGPVASTAPEPPFQSSDALRCAVCGQVVDYSDGVLMHVYPHDSRFTRHVPTLTEPTPEPPIGSVVVLRLPSTGLWPAKRYATGWRFTTSGVTYTWPDLIDGFEIVAIHEREA
jgi:hypothetical protein